MGAPNKKGLAIMGAIAALGAVAPIVLMNVIRDRTDAMVAERIAESAAPVGSAAPVHPRRSRRSGSGAMGVSVESEPIRCSGEGIVVRSNEELIINASLAAHIGRGCLLKLVNVELRAADGIVLEGGRFEMVNGSIEARGVAIRATGESVVELTGVDVRGATALEIGGTTRVRATDSTLRASGAAIAARDEAQVALSNTEVDGPVAQDESARVTRDDDGTGSDGAEAADDEGEGA